MRAVTQEELQQIAGGLIKKAPPKLREMLMKPPGGSGGGTPGTWNNPVTVYPTGGGGGYPTGSGIPTTGGNPWGPGIGGGGGGGSSPAGSTGNPTSEMYYDGTHTILSMGYTEKYTPGNTHFSVNNPGNLRYESWESKFGASSTVNGFAAFDTEQGGRNALGALLDGTHYSQDTMTSFVTDGFNGGSSQQQAAEQQNVLHYMAQYGFPATVAANNVAISKMSESEFNTFLDAITVAEGETNL